MKILVENKFGTGVVRRNPLIKIFQKILKILNGQKIGKSAVPFDWNKGYDVHDTIGIIKIKNQGLNYSCGRQAGSYFQEIQERLRGVSEGEISAKSGYGLYCSRGGGMTVTSIMTDIGAWGANLEATVPSYDAYGNPLPEYLIEEQSWCTPQMIADANKRAGYTPFDISKDFETVAETVRDIGACIIEIRGNNNSTWLTAYPSINKVNDYWFHYLCVIGAKMINNKKYLIVLNSWGNIGDNGVQYFGEEWFTAGNVTDVFTFIYDAQLQPLPTNNSGWAEIARYFRRIWGIAQTV